MTYNLIFIANLTSFACLIIASFYSFYVHNQRGETVLSDEEDAFQLKLERAAYSTGIWFQTAFSISFVTFLAAFMLERDTNPTIALYAIVIFTFSIIFATSSTYLLRYIKPDFKMPDPRSPTYQQELFDSYDDGEKYLMLKGLYKLYFLIIAALVFLGMALMYYSVFTGNSQLISIIGIGVVLLFIQTFYSISLKPKKA